MTNFSALFGAAISTVIIITVAIFEPGVNTQFYYDERGNSTNDLISSGGRSNSEPVSRIPAQTEGLWQHNGRLRGNQCVMSNIEQRKSEVGSCWTPNDDLKDYSKETLPRSKGASPKRRKRIVTSCWKVNHKEQEVPDASSADAIEQRALRDQANPPLYADEVEKKATECKGGIQMDDLLGLVNEENGP